jgi:hypothetical protein
VGTAVRCSRPSRLDLRAGGVAAHLRRRARRSIFLTCVVSTLRTFILQLVTSASRSLKQPWLAGWKAAGAAASFLGGCIDSRLHCFSIRQGAHLKSSSVRTRRSSIVRTRRTSRRVPMIADRTLALSIPLFKLVPRSCVCYALLDRTLALSIPLFTLVPRSCV